MAGTVYLAVGVILFILVVIAIITVVVMKNEISGKNGAQNYRNNSYDREMRYDNTGAGRTNVLDSRNNETTLLGFTENMTPITLVRTKNQERIVISKPYFMIGKEKRRVDYCIDDNNSISRVHTRFCFKNGNMVIVDMNSTNGTFLNGVKLVPNQDSILKSGDLIRMADEEFRVFG